MSMNSISNLVRTAGTGGGGGGGGHWEIARVYSVV